MDNTLRKQLYRSIEKSDIRMLQNVLKQGVSTSYHPDDHNPVMHEAVNCGRNDMEIIKTLLANGADINAKERYRGDTPLHWLVGRGQCDLLKWFLAHHADVHKVNDAGETPLLGLARLGIHQEDDGEEAILREYELLLDASANVNALDKKQKSALHYVAAHGLSAVAELLIQRGARVDAKDENGSTPLHVASDKACTEIVKMLIRYGAEMDLTDNGQMTPLHIIADKYPKAISTKDYGIARILIQKGANIESADKSGCTALCSAAHSGNDEIGEILIAHGADVNVGGGDALRNAIFFEHDHFVELLLKSGASANLQDTDELNGALHIAASEDYVFGIKTLLKYGADKELLNIDGETALCVAIRRDSTDSVCCLIKAGANVNHKDNYGNTPLFLARRRNNEIATNALLAAGAKE